MSSGWREREKGRGSRSLCISIPKRQDGDIGKAREGRKLLTSLASRKPFRSACFRSFRLACFRRVNELRRNSWQMGPRFCFSASSVRRCIHEEREMTCWSWVGSVRWFSGQNRRGVRISAPTCEFSRGDAGCLIERDRVAKEKQLHKCDQTAFESSSELEGEYPEQYPLLPRTIEATSYLEKFVWIIESEFSSTRA